MVWMASNSSATSCSFCERTSSTTRAARARSAVASGPLAEAASARAVSTWGSRSTRRLTSRANTVAAAGAPPITEAKEPSTAAISIVSVRALENTTKAPPW